MERGTIHGLDHNDEIYASSQRRGQAGKIDFDNEQFAGFDDGVTITVDLCNNETWICAKLVPNAKNHKKTLSVFAFAQICEFASI